MLRLSAHNVIMTGYRVILNEPKVALTDVDTTWASCDNAWRHVILNEPTVMLTDVDSMWARCDDDWT